MDLRLPNTCPCFVIFSEPIYGLLQSYMGGQKMKFNIQQTNLPWSNGVNSNLTPAFPNNPRSLSLDAGFRNWPSAAFRFHCGICLDVLRVRSTISQRTSIFTSKCLVSSGARRARISASRFHFNDSTILFTTNSMLTSSCSETKERSIICENG